MATRVYLALDFFFHRWNSGEKAAWLGIQPYIEHLPANHIEHWIKNEIHIGQNTTFELITPSLVNNLGSSQLVPVPLPSKLALRCEFYDKSGAIIYQTSLNRAQHCLINNLVQLRDLNQFAATDSTVNKLTENANSNADSFSYPWLFAETLRLSITNNDDDDEPKVIPIQLLVDQLQLKLELGQRQKYDNDCFVSTSIGTPFDAKHLTDEDRLFVTNTHYLLGQLLHLGSDIDKLRQYHNFKLFIGEQELTCQDNGSTAAIFRTIQPSFEPQHFSQQLLWHSDFARRINAKPQGDVFKASKLPSGCFIWRLGQKNQQQANAETFGNQVYWSALERLDIREKANVANSLLTEAELARLSIQPAITFEVQLIRYRQTPHTNTTDLDTLTSMLVAIEPTSAGQVRFKQLLKQHRQLFSTASIYVQNARVAVATDPSQTIEISYQIKPRKIEVFSFPWRNQSDDVLAFFDIGPECIANLPPDISFNFADLIYQNAILVISLDTACELNRAGGDFNNDIATDIFGPRWEYWHQTQTATLPNFDALFCSQLDKYAANFDLDQLIVAAFHTNKKDFELAQSARRLEAVVHARFNGIRETDPTDINSYSFEQTLIEDKTNHNQLNVIEKRTYGSEQNGNFKAYQQHRNSSSAIPAVKAYMELSDNPLLHNLSYIFHITMTDRTSAPLPGAQELIKQQLQAQPANLEPSARDFYSNVYRNIGQNRSLSLNLEHTYGTCILHTEQNQVPNPLDEPILLGTEVAYVNGEQPRRLWQAELNSADKQAITITLHLDKALLDPEWIYDENNQLNKERALAHIQAWQSVAEIHYAESVILVAECYNYNVHLVNETNADQAIQAGLEKHEIIFSGNEQNEIKAAISAIFTNLDTAPDFISITIPAQDDYHAIRLRLDIIRPDQMVPDTNADNWHVHQRLLKIPDNDPELLFNQSGFATEELSGNEIKQQVSQYLQNLKKRGGYFYPKTAEADARQRNQRFSALLGSGQTPEHAIPSENSWIIPGAIKAEQGAINVAYCPIGITPVANNMQLQHRTAAILQRYFSALQSIVDFESRLWFQQDATTLFNNIKALENTANSGPYRALIKAASDKFKALPDHKAGSNLLIDDIRHLAKRSIPNPGNSLGNKLHQYLQHQLTTKPGLFASLKAIGLIQIQAAQNDLRNDYYNLYIRRKTDDSSGQIEGAVLPGQLLHTEKNQRVYIEQLDDEQYDNRFDFSAVFGETAERLLEQYPAGQPHPQIQIPLFQQRIIIPEANPRHIDQAFIRLASRMPVQNPALAIIKQTYIATSPYNQPLSLAALLNGEIKAGQNSNDVLLQDCLLSPNGQNAFTHTKLDEIIVSAIFKIEGDEESASDNISLSVTDKFINDAFFVLASESKATPHTASNTELPKQFNQLIKILEDKQPLSLQHELAKLVLDHDNMQCCTTILKQPPASKQLPDSQAVQVAFQIINNEIPDKLSLKKFDGNDSGRNRVWLFKNSNNDTFLWLELKLPVWSSQRISLVQTRNQAGIGDAQQRIFAPEFASISDEAGAVVDRNPLCHNIGRNFPNRPQLKKEKMSVITFSRAVLSQHIDIEDNFLGRHCHLQVTLKEDASSAFPSDQGDSTLVDNGSFAVSTLSIKAEGAGTNDWNTTELDWFPDNARPGHWLIDFEWRDPENNDTVLRIDNAPVSLKDDNNPEIVNTNNKSKLLDYRLGQIGAPQSTLLK